MKGSDLKVDYSTYTAWLKCSKCLVGKIEYIHTERGPIHNIDIKPCDNCRKQFGLKACEKLELIEVI